VEIKAADVKTLRDKTGVGMMDCKNALEKAGGDFAKAEKILKELGLAAAQKRSGRATKEGKVFARVANGKAALLELLCETDFVARNSDFQAVGAELLSLVLATNPKAVTPQMQDLVNGAIAKIKENMGVGRFEVMDAAANELLVSYVHGDKLGVVVKLRVSSPALKDDPKVKEAAMDCALHAAAFAPLALTQADVSPAYLKEQEEIFAVQAKNTGKPDNVVQGIVKGKLKKHLQEICFVDQLHVKQTKKSVAEVLRELGKDVGGEITLAAFRYYKLGAE
jgi:elongation factor Ts